MKRPLPETPADWLDEIRLAIADAAEAAPFGAAVGEQITDANLFHLAPLVALKFRGLDYRDEKLRRKVTEGALASYVANSDPEEGIDHGLEQRPLLAFVLCYVVAHLVLDLIDERQAEEIMAIAELGLE
ncbi:MAG: hypothetical protein RIC55_21030 [Pirellulaceae bacterium]